MTITQDDVAVMKMEIAYLESALLDARNQIASLRAERATLADETNKAKVLLQVKENELQVMTWRALAAEGSNESFMRRKFELKGE